MGDTRRYMFPGFSLCRGISVFYISALVLVPCVVLATKAAFVPPAKIVQILSDPRVLAAFRVSLGCAFLAACINALIGVLLAWVLTRYRFWGRGILDALIDFPFALPTAVAGISLTTLYGPKGTLGAFFSSLGVQVAFTRVGITLALIFVGLPFVVRSVQPVLAAVDRDTEDAARILGASAPKIFTSIILPALIPAVLSGFSLAFARGIGEFGSVVFIAGNMPLRTEIVPLLIMTKLEQFDVDGAIVLGTAMLVVSVILLFAISRIQARFELQARSR